MRSLLITIFTPFPGLLFRIGRIPEKIHIQHRTSETSVEPLHVTILRRPRPRIENIDLIGFTALLEVVGNKFSPVGASNILWLAIISYHLFQHTYNSFGRHRNRHRLADRDPVTVIYYILDSKLFATFQYIAHKSIDHVSLNDSGRSNGFLTHVGIFLRRTLFS